MSHHGFLVRGARNGHTTAGALSLLGELYIHLPMILRDQTVIEVIIFDLKEDGLAIHIVPWLQEVDNFGGDEDAVAVNGLHSYEASVGNKQYTTESNGTAVNQGIRHIQGNEGNSQLRVDVVSEVEELLLTISLCG